MLCAISLRQLTHAVLDACAPLPQWPEPEEVAFTCDPAIAALLEGRGGAVDERRVGAVVVVPVLEQRGGRVDHHRRLLVARAADERGLSVAIVEGKLRLGVEKWGMLNVGAAGGGLLGPC